MTIAASKTRDDDFTSDGRVTISLEDYRALIAVADMNRDEIDAAVAEAVLRVRRPDDAVPHEVVQAKALDGAAPVAAWRAYRRMTITALSIESGVDEPIVAAADQGVDVSARALARIAAALETRIDNLVDAED